METLTLPFQQNIQRMCNDSLRTMARTVNHSVYFHWFSHHLLVRRTEITFHYLLSRKLHKFTTSNQLKIRCVYELLHTITMKEMIKIGGQKQALSITNICYILHVHTVVCFVYSNKPLSFIILKRKCLIAIKFLSNENK